MKREIELPLELVVENVAPLRIEGMVIGTLVSTDDSGRAYIQYPSQPQPEPLLAQSTVPLKKEDIGRRIALMFEMGDSQKPIIVGIIQNPEPKASSLLHEILSMEGKRIDVRVDGERVTLTAEKEIVLKCGEASITLTRAGKIVLRGTHLVSRSSGINRIKGGSVQIN